MFKLTIEDPIAIPDLSCNEDFIAPHVEGMHGTVTDARGDVYALKVMSISHRLSTFPAQPKTLTLEMEAYVLGQIDDDVVKSELGAEETFLALLDEIEAIAKRMRDRVSG